VGAARIDGAVSTSHVPHASQTLSN
jgi:hypothetical protein